LTIKRKDSGKNSQATRRQEKKLDPQKRDTRAKSDSEMICREKKIKEDCWVYIFWLGTEGGGKRRGASI